MTPADLVVITVAISVGALTKSVLGMGLPLIGVPVLASIYGPERAVLVLALPTFVANMWLLWQYRSWSSHTRHLRVMVVLGLAGTVAGTFLLTRAQPAWLAILLGAMVYVYLTLRLVQPRLRLPTAVARRTAPGVGLVGGVLHGATGMPGPVLATYLHAFGLPQGAFVFSINALFQSYAVAQIATFAALGHYTQARLVESLLSLVPVLVMFPLGIRLAGRIDRRRYEQLVLLLLAIMGARLLVDGLRGM